MMSARELLEECKKALIATRTTDISIKHQALIDQIDAELAKLEPYPIGYVPKSILGKEYGTCFCTKNTDPDVDQIPVYGEPPQRKPLSNSEIDNVLSKSGMTFPSAHYAMLVARAIEKAHGIE